MPKHPKWITYGAAFLLSAPVGFLFLAIYSFNSRISVAEEKIIQVEEESTSQKKKIDDIHWYLIKRNGVEVPEDER